ncbi:MAG: tryptophan--tRNA ligase [Bacteroidetes bacterium]|nr:tryptophan--tRNA ligase [Bacteroidota bacterium]
MKEIVVSGIRPTGKLHLGNYFGAVASFLKMQNDYNCFFFIADIHSLTTHPVPNDLHNNVKQVLAEYLALGLNPDKCTLFIQSDVPQVTELYTYMNMNAYIGELERSASFKEKIRTQPDNVNAGLLTYPVLMAADILIHKANKVPVGKDQQQHLEMTRQFGNRFNRLYNVDYFPEPIAFANNNELVKVPGLSGAGKMSKSVSETDAIFLADAEEINNKKIMRAKTDSGPTQKNQKKPQEIQNLFDLLKLVSDEKTVTHYEIAYNDCTIKYGEFKKALATDMEFFLKPIREKIAEIFQNDKLITEVAKTGAQKARESADRTLKEVREIIGFRKFY